MNKRPSETQNKQEGTSSRAAALVRELWLGTCARFTVLCLGLLLISTLVSDTEGVAYVDNLRFALLLPFSFFLMLAAKTRRADRLATGAKCALHPILVLGGFYLCCYLPFQIRSNAAAQQILLFLLLSALVYGLCMGIFCLISHLIRRKKADDTPYVSQYSRK